MISCATKSCSRKRCGSFPVEQHRSFPESVTDFIAQDKFLCGKFFLFFLMNHQTIILDLPFSDFPFALRPPINLTLHYRYYRPCLLLCYAPFTSCLAFHIVIDDYLTATKLVALINRAGYHALIIP